MRDICGGSAVDGGAVLREVMGVISYHDQTVCRVTINNTHIRLLTASVPDLLQAPT